MPHFGRVPTRGFINVETRIMRILATSLVYFHTQTSPNERNILEKKMKKTQFIFRIDG